MLQTLYCRGSVSVEDLSEAFEASEMTARRDPNRFAARGFVRGIHSDASPSVSRGCEPPIMKEENLAEKRLTGKEAAGPVGNGETPIMDGLPRRWRSPGRVLANSLLVATGLPSHRGFSVCPVGGLVSRRCLPWDDGAAVKSFGEKAIVVTWGKTGNERSGCLGGSARFRPRVRVIRIEVIVVGRTAKP